MGGWGGSHLGKDWEEGREGSRRGRALDLKGKELSRWEGPCWDPTVRRYPQPGSFGGVWDRPPSSYKFLSA